MKGKRRRHDPEFKARVALEVLKGVKTIQQIAKEFEIHSVQVSDWKKTMAEGAASCSAPVPVRPMPRASDVNAPGSTPRSASRPSSWTGWQNSPDNSACEGSSWVGGRRTSRNRHQKTVRTLGVARSTVGYQAVPEDPEGIRIKRLLDEIYMIDPSLGSRRLVAVASYKP
jgi:hypothetical protein